MSGSTAPQRCPRPAASTCATPQQDSPAARAPGAWPCRLDALDRAEGRAAPGLAAGESKVQAFDVNGMAARATVGPAGVEWTYSPRRGCVPPPCTSETGGRPGTGGCYRARQRCWARGVPLYRRRRCWRARVAAAQAVGAAREGRESLQAPGPVRASRHSSCRRGPAGRSPPLLQCPSARCCRYRRWTPCGEGPSSAPASRQAAGGTPHDLP